MGATRRPRETREQRIGAEDGRDICWPNSCNPTARASSSPARSSPAPAALGATAGAGTAAAFPRTGRVSALIGLAVGAAVGAAARAAVGDYLKQRRHEADDGQAALDHLVAADLERENAGFEQAQCSFDELLDCRVCAAQEVREAAPCWRRRRGLPRSGSVQGATWNWRSESVPASVNAAMTSTLPSTRLPRRCSPGSPAQNATAQAVVVLAVAVQLSVPVWVRPASVAPAVEQVAPHQPVQVRPARTPGFAVVETERGQRLGYAPV